MNFHKTLPDNRNFQKGVLFMNQKYFQSRSSFFQVKTPNVKIKLEFLGKVEIFENEKIEIF